VAAYNSQNRPGTTVSRIAALAQPTLSAARIDLSYHTLTHELHTLRALNHAHELMTDRALKSGVPTDDLNISVADAAFRNADHGFTRGQRPGHVRQRKRSILKSQCLHRAKFTSAKP